MALLAGSLLGHPGLTSPSPGSLLVGGGILSLLTALLLGTGSETRVRRGVLWGLGLLLWSCAAAVQSLDLHLSLLQLTSLAGGLAVMTATSLLATDRKWWRLLARVAVGLSVTSALWAIYSTAVEQSWGRLSGNFTNPDTLAIVLFVGFCLAAGLLSQDRPRGILPLLFSVAILLVASAATQSRSILAAYLAAVLVVLVSANHKTRRNLLKGLALLFLILIPSLGFLVTSGKLETLANRVQSVTTSRYDIPLRLEFLAGSWPCAFERPVLGSGPGTFPLAYQEFRPTDTRAPGEYVNAAHNDTIQLLVECGVPGMILWLSLLMSAIQGTWHNRRESEATWMTACLVGLFAYSFFNFIIPVPATLLWLFFVLGLSLALSGSSTKAEWSESQQTAIAAVLLTLGLFSLLIGVRRIRAQKLSQMAQEARVSLHWKKVAQALDGAVRMEPLNVDHRLQRAQLVQEMTTLFSRGDWSEQVAHDLARAQNLSPRDLQVLSANFRFHLRQGHLSKALDVAKDCHLYAPYDKRGLRRMAGVQVLKGNLGKASELIQPQDRQSSELMAQLFYHMGAEGLESLRDLPPDARREVGEALRALALKRGQSVLLDDVYSIILPLQKSNSLRLELQRVKDLRHLHDPRWERLAQDLVGSKNQEREEYDQSLLLWAEWKGVSALPRLRDYLKSHPKKSAIRLAASELLPPDLATELIQQGLERSPNDVRLLERQGDLFAHNDLPKIALEYYQKALKLGGGSSSLKSKIERMEKL